MLSSSYQENILWLQIIVFIKYIYSYLTSAKQWEGSWVQPMPGAPQTYYFDWDLSGRNLDLIMLMRQNTIISYPDGEVSEDGTSDDSSECKCNNHVQDDRGDCKEAHYSDCEDGGPWCYIDDSVQCGDSKTSKIGAPYKWSCEACRLRRQGEDRVVSGVGRWECRVCRLF